jgi:uncharacterized Tic20 family protein
MVAGVVVVILSVVALALVIVLRGAQPGDQSLIQLIGFVGALIGILSAVVGTASMHAMVHDQISQPPRR